VALQLLRAQFFLGSPIAKAVALNYAYPIAVVFLTYVLFKDLPNKKNLLAIFLSLISIPLLLEIWKIKNISEISKGDFLAWLNSFFYGGMIVWGTKIRKETRLNPFTSLFYSLLLAILWLFILGFVLSLMNIDLYVPTIRINMKTVSWLTLMGLGLFGTVAPLSLIYFGATKLKPYVISVLLLTEPVWVYLFGLILFGQQLSFWAILGVIGILISILLI